MLYNAKANLYNLWQGNLSNNDYLRKFNSLVDVAVFYNSQVHNNAICNIVTMSEHGDATNYDNIQDDEKTEVNEKTHELYCATIFLAQSDKRRYEKLLENLKNTYTHGNDDYPQDMVQAFKLLNKF